MAGKPLFELPKLLTLSGVDVESVASVEKFDLVCKDGGCCCPGGACSRGCSIPIE